MTTYRVTLAATLDHPTARTWTYTAKTAGDAQTQVMVDNHLTWGHLHLISTEEV